jgi:hypothetical protein
MSKEKIHVIEMIKKLEDNTVLLQIKDLLDEKMTAKSQMPQRLIDKCIEASRLYDLGLLETIPMEEVHRNLLQKKRL